MFCRSACPPSQYGEPWAQRRREAMRGHRSRSLIAQIHTPQRGTPLSGLFRSFFQGGFECSTHRRKDGVRLDMIDATSHDVLAAEDYRLLATLRTSAPFVTVCAGILLRKPGQYDWSSFLPMLRAAQPDQYPNYLGSFSLWVAGLARYLESRVYRPLCRLC